MAPKNKTVKKAPARKLSESYYSTESDEPAIVQKQEEKPAAKKPMQLITDSGLVYEFITINNKTIVATPYDKNNDAINISIKPDVSIVDALANGIFIASNNKISIDLSKIYDIFAENSVFIHKHAKSIVDKIRTHHTNAISSISSLQVFTRTNNPDHSYNVFAPIQIEKNNVADTHYVGIYYEEKYNVVKIAFGSLEEDPIPSRMWMFTFTMEKDDYGAHVYNAMSKFLSATFPDTFITQYNFEPVSLWVDATFKMQALLRMIVMREIITKSIPRIQEELIMIKEKKQTILAAQEIESRKDETIPVDLPVIINQ